LIKGPSTLLFSVLVSPFFSFFYFLYILAGDTGTYDSLA